MLLSGIYHPVEGKMQLFKVRKNSRLKCPCWHGLLEQEVTDGSRTTYLLLYKDKAECLSIQPFIFFVLFNLFSLLFVTNSTGDAYGLNELNQRRSFVELFSSILTSFICLSRSMSLMELISDHCCFNFSP